MQPVSIVIDDRFPRSVVHDRLSTIEAWPFFPFPRLNGQAAKFNSIDDRPGIFLASQDLNAVKTGRFERFQKRVFAECTTNTAALYYYQASATHARIASSSSLLLQA